ncbi:winged helix-turn-helix transcriptional regulator [Granulicella sibirica]|uniref:winged helix-turn-helix transcriptional regulator n=1 Tax=Granulicella sibirica TaxID=2479048 RepID=UPI00100923D1|nr:helix-turn-helix domain-containing protein [Granulicella sibirica]
MSWGSTSESFCNIARSLSVVGDRWTLLIMREISLKVRRFEEIQAQTGMSSHLLANRLKRLEEDKIIERRVYSARPLRHEYFATDKGRDLDAVILSLRNWDLRWGGSDGKGAAAVAITDKRTGKAIDGTWHNPTGESFSFANTTSVMSEAWRAEREANAAAFYAAKKLSPARLAKSAATAKSAKKVPTSKTVSKKSASRKVATSTIAARKAATKKSSKAKRSA